MIDKNSNDMNNYSWILDTTICEFEHQLEDVEEPLYSMYKDFSERLFDAISIAIDNIEEELSNEDSTINYEIE